MIVLVFPTLKTKLSCKVRPQEQMRRQWVRRLNHWATAAVLMKYWKTQAATDITHKALTRHSDSWYSICQLSMAGVCKQRQAVDWTLASLPGYARWNTCRGRALTMSTNHMRCSRKRTDKQRHGLLDYYNIDNWQRKVWKLYSMFQHYTLCIVFHCCVILLVVIRFIGS